MMVLLVSFQRSCITVGLLAVLVVALVRLLLAMREQMTVQMVHSLEALTAERTDELSLVRMGELVLR